MPRHARAHFDNMYFIIIHDSLFQQFGHLAELVRVSRTAVAKGQQAGADPINEWGDHREAHLSSSVNAGRTLLLLKVSLGSILLVLFVFLLLRSIRLVFGFYTLPLKTQDAGVEFSVRFSPSPRASFFFPSDFDTQFAGTTARQRGLINMIAIHL